MSVIVRRTWRLGWLVALCGVLTLAACDGDGDGAMDPVEGGDAGPDEVIAPVAPDGPPMRTRQITVIQTMHFVAEDPPGVTWGLDLDGEVTVPGRDETPEPRGGKVGNLGDSVFFADEDETRGGAGLYKQFAPRSVQQVVGYGHRVAVRLEQLDQTRVGFLRGHRGMDEGRPGQDAQRSRVVLHKVSSSLRSSPSSRRLDVLRAAERNGSGATGRSTETRTVAR